jgi:hypothetical protein
MNVFSRYTLYLVYGGKICPYDVIYRLIENGETEKNKYAYA